MDPKRTCPVCDLVFDATPSEAGCVACPRCDASVPCAAAARAPSYTADTAGAHKNRRHALRGAVAIGSLIFVIGGLVYAGLLLPRDDRKPAGQPPQTTLAPRVVEPLILKPTSPPPPIDPAPPPTARPKPPPAPPAAPAAKPAPAPPPLPDPAPDSEPLAVRVNRAIDRGVECLRREYCPPNVHGAGGWRSLLGLTLLECGASPDDPAVRQLADEVRSQKDVTRTYDLALAILFLDRLGNPGDNASILTFAERLVAGQTAAGAWSYQCSEPQPRQNVVLPVPHDQLFVPHDQAFVPHDQLFVPHDPVVGPAQPVVVPNVVHSAPQPRRLNLPGDHSNTQFALLGLWVARRHGAPVGPALSRAARYFEEIQHDDGSWAYQNSGDQSRPSMTCVGLVSLAMASRAQTGDGGYRAPVAKALQFLGGVLDSTSPERGEAPNVQGGYPTYFLWSIERTGVIYDLRTIGGKEWYPWAAEWLVSAQQEDGGWADGLQKPVATCLALLVLKRSNVTLDLLVRKPPPPGDPADPTFTGPIILQGQGPDLMPGTGTSGGPAAAEKGARQDGQGTPGPLNGFPGLKKQ